MKKIIFFFCIIFPFFGISQQLSLVTPLSDALDESSGLLYIDDNIISHNDSGQEAELYVLDRETGEILRTVVIENAVNTDWEDICYDDEFIYIGDIGNNLGARTDLKIYKIAIADFNNYDSVTAEIIEFNYADQLDFTSSQYTTNFDAESILSYEDKLYVLTKNWGDNWTSVYEISKQVGSYSAEKVDSINIQGYATGASYNENNKTMVISGYTIFSTFVVTLTNISTNVFSEGVYSKYFLNTPAGYSSQIESVTFEDDYKVLVSSEVFGSTASALYSIDFEEIFATSVQDISLSNERELLVYPNPAINTINVGLQEFRVAEVLDVSGKLLLKSTKQSIDVSKLSAGVYMLRVTAESGTVSTQRFVVE